jgi:ATP-dependent DNA helicase DinG
LTGTAAAISLDEDSILAELEEGGAIAKRIPHYESRSEQLNLMRLIIRAFNENAIAAAEAGTGVGKSFAYLLPAIRYALLWKNRAAEAAGAGTDFSGGGEYDADEDDGGGASRRIVVSTATINLQQQLFEKDIPFLFSACGINSVKNEKRGANERYEVKAVLIKGRGNFLCLRRLRDLEKERGEQTGFFPDVKEKDFDALLEWAAVTKTGEKSDIPFMPPPELWMEAGSDADSCMNARCPFFSACFYMKNRREAADADILVVNHHVLFADLAARHEGAGYDGNAVLPAYERIILDEAHRIEDSATSFFSGSFSRPAMTRRISRLYRHKTRGVKAAAHIGAENGLLVRLRAYMTETIIPTEKDAAITGGILQTLENLDAAALEICGTEALFRFIPGRDA